MIPPVLAPIVEGDGEQQALLPLIHNVIASSRIDIWPKIMPPYKIPRGTMINRTEEFKRRTAVAARDGGPNARMLVLLDADEDCPVDIGPTLLQHVAARLPDRIISVNVADWEYESWFIASAESIAYRLGIDTNIDVPPNIEEFGAKAKGWLEQHLLVGGKYRETVHQASFSSLMDVPLARHRSQSFDRFCSEVERLLSA